MLDRGIHVQIVTSAFSADGAGWATLCHLHVVVSIDGLNQSTMSTRAGTYDRILKNIAGQQIRSTALSPVK